ncbi:MAG: hypothetical protein ACE5LB_08685 [Acidiferrobacterales bacterium]
MNARFMASMMIIGGLAAGQWAGAHELTGKAKGQVDTIAGLVKSHPEIVIDFSKKSGEYCMNTWKVGGSHMTHYAIDRSKTVEDVIDFVKVASLKGSIDVNSLPLAPTKLGAKKPNQWYYLPAGRHDPHHGKALPKDLLVRATNVE